MKVLVCGSRSWDNTQLIADRLVTLEKGSEVLQGGAFGADAIAAEYAERIGLRVRWFPADWKTYGRKAGYLRNIQMLNERPDLVIAFWDGKSPGTAHTIREAKRRQIPVEIISP